jgi:hypothetical protein
LEEFITLNQLPIVRAPDVHHMQDGFQKEPMRINCTYRYRIQGVVMELPHLEKEWEKWTLFALKLQRNVE